MEGFADLPIEIVGHITMEAGREGFELAHD